MCRSNVPEMSNILIVHAHHEPQSFSSSLAKMAADTLTSLGHQVVFSDLYAMGFQPVSDRRNFTTTADPNYLKQQQEEAFAYEHQGFAADIETEMRKVEACDLLIFSFPLWWFGLPAILKGWVDRVFAYQRIYSRGKWYENGVGQGKRALILMTTGGSARKYSPAGIHPALESVLAPIHEGIFWFNGFAPLPPFVAWEAAHVTNDDRRALLDSLRSRITNVLTEPVIELPRSTDFDPLTGVDTMVRFMVVIRRMRVPVDKYRSLVPAEVKFLKNLHREGKLLNLHITPEEVDQAAWCCFLTIRERSLEAVRDLCAALPLAGYLSFEITPLDSTRSI